MAEIPSSHQDILHSTAVAYLATIGPKGEPQVSAVLFGWNGTELVFSLNKVRQKHRNLLREQRVAIAIADPTNPYRSLELRGVARLEDDPNHQIAHMLSRKYIGRDASPDELPADEERGAVFVVPERIITFPATEQAP